MDRRRALKTLGVFPLLLTFLAGYDGGNTTARSNSTALEGERQITALAEVTLRIDGMT